MTVMRPTLMVIALLSAISFAALPMGRSDALMAMDPDIEEDVEEQAEQQAEEEAEEEAEAQAEDEAEAEAEAQAEQEAEEQAEAEAEQQAEQEAEEQAEAEAEQQAEQEAEAEAEQQAEQEAEEQAEQEAEEQAETEAEDQAEQEAEEQAEGEAEEQAEQDAEDEAEAEAEDQAEQEAEDDAEDEAEDQAEQEAEDDAEDEAEDEAEDLAEGEIEDETSDDADDEFEEAGDRAEDEIEFEAEDEVEYEEIEEEAADLSSSFEASLELDGIEIDEDQFEYARGEWLVLSTSRELEQMVAAGFEIRSTERVELLGQVLSRLGSPSGLADRASRNTLLAIAPNADVEYNHLYSPQARFKRGQTGRAPLAAMPLSQSQRATRAKIGLIDTALSQSHSAFAQANVVSSDFLLSKNPRPTKHGTAVASILVGQDRDVQGLLPRAKLYAASVFEQLPGRGSTASTAALVRALDWMVANQVKVVNMSLSGPPNRILKQAIAKAASRGVTIVAAAGNEGPSSKPLFPAAYPGVVSVTALDQNNRVFRMANRGQYLEFAAPGVNIRHAANGDAPNRSSGTSIAAPFVSAVLLLARGRNGRLDKSELDALRARAVDLGPRGRDPIYGNGLIRPQ